MTAAVDADRKLRGDFRARQDIGSVPWTSARFACSDSREAVKSAEFQAELAAEARAAAEKALAETQLDQNRAELVELDRQLLALQASAEKLTADFQAGLAKLGAAAWELQHRGVELDRAVLVATGGKAHQVDGHARWSPVVQAGAAGPGSELQVAVQIAVLASRPKTAADFIGTCTTGPAPKVTA
ncbi:MAG: hypothetical protein IPL34_20535 [Thiofilum sp.]|uniref:hypothetical protein n=1 Tax=Thiofilum sp. TaxID=2212733 RepID=UPI0025FB2D18|nr:hypothetical protein [Thiofilum sp.]MBK8455671.1 hypothetical protein [Thiofilum sp.]